MTFMAALRHDRITALWFIEGPINGEAFLFYIEKVLRPDPAARRHRHHGQSRLTQGHRRASRHPYRRRSVSSTLPKDFARPANPIEQFFAKFKHWLRKAAQRTTEAVYDAIAPILDTVSSAECANYFANAGYMTKPANPSLLLGRRRTRAAPDASGWQRPLAFATKCQSPDPQVPCYRREEAAPSLQSWSFLPLPLPVIYSAEIRHCGS